MCETRISNLLGKITVLFVICCCCFPAQAKYGGGSGTAQDPYLIYDANQMNEIGLHEEDWGKHFKLMADIDLSEYTGTEFNIIGRWVKWSSPNNKPFIGLFDGNGHTISNFTYTSTDTDYIGLFRYVDDSNAVIKDLGLIDPNVDAGTGRRVGSLLGWLQNGTITGCYVEGGSVVGDDDVGGLVGIGSFIKDDSEASPGTISNCFSNVSVTGDDYVGGLVGNNLCTITNCYSTGSTSGDHGVGGLLGHNGGYYSYGTTISNCYSSGSVSGNSNVGGLVGANLSFVVIDGHAFIDCGRISSCYATSSVSGGGAVGGLVGGNGDGAITNCYSTGSVSGNYDVGGLVGWNPNGTVLSSFWDIDTSFQTISAGGTQKTTEQMQDLNTFSYWGACGNEGVWTIDDGNDYPRFAWQNLQGVLIVTYGPVYGGGSGTEANPYQIWTAEQLNTIGLIPCHWDKHFKLMSDVDLDSYIGAAFNNIGGNWYYPFTGVFDGNGHTISNFTYTSTGTSLIGLFRCVSGVNAEIKNLGLIDPNVDTGSESRRVGSLVGINGGTITGCYVEGGSVRGSELVGGLVGLNYDDGTITNCYSTGSVTGSWSVGGLLGENYGTISNCYSAGSVAGGEKVGGLVGDNSYAFISNCYSKSDVSGDYDVGGLVGGNHYGTITNCYSSSHVSGSHDIGGLVGRNHYGTITNCYSTGSISGGRNVGGLVGLNHYGTISNCYTSSHVSGSHYIGGLVGGDRLGVYTSSFWDNTVNPSLTGIGNSTDPNVIGESTTNMQTMSTFTDAGWDFVGETFNGIEDIWFIPQQDYPHLWWEGMQVPMKLTPRTLNCRSKGNWVKAHLTLPEGFTVADVDSNRPAVLHSFGFQSLPLYIFVNKDKRIQIEAAFEREAVCSLAGDWPQELTVAGFLTDGNIFLGTSTVRIIHPGMKVIEELANCWLQGDCIHPTWCDGIDMNRDSVVNLLDYALLMNINVEFVTDE